MAHKETGAGGDLGRLAGFQSCPECGAPVRLATNELLRRAFDCLREETRQMLGLCERCRRCHLQRDLIAAYGGGKRIPAPQVTFEPDKLHGVFLASGPNKPG